MNTKLSLNFNKSKLKPATSKLYGCLKGGAVSKKDYKKHLENKYL